MDATQQLRDIKSSLNELHRARTADARPRMSGRERFAKHVTFNLLRVNGIDEGEEFKRIFPSLARAASGPATTTNPSWAGQLIASDLIGLLADAQPPSIFTQLRDLGLAISLAGVGSAAAAYPVPAAQPRSSWVGEQMAIPVIQLAFSRLNVAPKKVAVITELSGELRRRSPLNVEAALGNILSADVRRAVDSWMLSDQAGSAIAPAGLLNGIAAVPGSADPAADLRALLADLIAKGGASPVLILPTTSSISLASWMRDVAVPVRYSTDLAADRAVAVDAAGFIASVGDVRVETGTEAVVHEDTVPAAITPPGGPMSSPTRSWWQSDVTGLRTIFEVAYGAVRVSWLDGIEW